MYRNVQKKLVLKWGKGRRHKSELLRIAENTFWFWNFWNPVIELSPRIRCGATLLVSILVFECDNQVVMFLLFWVVIDYACKYTHLRIMEVVKRGYIVQKCELVWSEKVLDMYDSSHRASSNIIIYLDWKTSLELSIHFECHAWFIFGKLRSLMAVLHQKKANVIEKINEIQGSMILQV